MIGKNSLCGDAGNIDMAENDCKKAAEERGLVFGYGLNPGYPKACFKFANQVYFNNQSVGSRQHNSAPICRKHQGKAWLVIIRWKSNLSVKA